MIKNLKDAKKLRKMLITYFEDGGELNTASQAIDQASPMLNAIGPAASIVTPLIQATVSGVQDNITRKKRALATKGLAGRMKIDTNPYMESGGQLRKFEGPSHDAGGIAIDENMMFNPIDPIAEVEGGETGYELASGGYIYSDKLSMGNKTFADHSKDIESKFKREDDITSATKTKSLENLSKYNDYVKEMKSMGGYLKKYFEGGSLANKENVINRKKYGGNLKKYEDGSNLIIPPTYDYDDKFYNENNYEIPQFTPYENSKQGNGVADPGFTGPLPTPSSTDESVFANNDSAQKRKPFNFNTIALGLKGAALGKSFFDSVQRPEEESLQLNPNAGEAEQISERLGINMQPIINEIDLRTMQGIQGSRNVAGSAITQQVLAQNSIQQGNRQIANTSIDAQARNNQFRASEAQLKAQLGSEERQERVRQQTVQSQNDAANRGFGRDFYSNLSQIGSQFNKHQYTKEAIANNKEIALMTKAEGFKALSQKYPNFTISQDDYDKWTELVKKGNHSEAEEFIKYRK